MYITLLPRSSTCIGKGGESCASQSVNRVVQNVPGLSVSCIHQFANQITAAAVTRRSRLSLQQLDCIYVCQDALHVMFAETAAYASLLLHQLCI